MCFPSRIVNVKIICVEMNWEVRLVLVLENAFHFCRLTAHTCRFNWSSRGRRSGGGNSCRAFLAERELSHPRCAIDGDNCEWASSLDWHFTVNILKKEYN